VSLSLQPEDVGPVDGSCGEKKTTKSIVWPPLSKEEEEKEEEDFEPPKPVLRNYQQSASMDFASHHSEVSIDTKDSKTASATWPPVQEEEEEEEAMSPSPTISMESALPAVPEQPQTVLLDVSHHSQIAVDQKTKTISITWPPVSNEALASLPQKPLDQETTAALRDAEPPKPVLLNKQDDTTTVNDDEQTSLAEALYEEWKTMELSAHTDDLADKDFDSLKVMMEKHGGSSLRRISTDLSGSEIDVNLYNNSHHSTTTITSDGDDATESASSFGGEAPASPRSRNPYAKDIAWEKPTWALNAGLKSPEKTSKPGIAWEKPEWAKKQSV
jgi:hypothetical protein